MKPFWIAVPYLCILAYVIFLFVSSDECMKGMNDFYDMPYHVSREVREIRGRLQTLRNTLPIAFSSPQIHYLQIEKMLDEHNHYQDASIDVIRQRFSDDPDGLLKKLDQYKEEVRKARSRVARATEGNDNMDFALAYYNAEISPALDKINAVLDEIGHKADEQGQIIRHSFEQRHLIIKIVAVILCLFVLSILLFNEMRDRAKRKAISHRDKLFNLLVENVDDVFLVSNNQNKIEFASNNCSRVLELPVSQNAEQTITNLYKRLNEAAGKWLKKKLSDKSEDMPQELEADLDNGNKKLKIRVYPISENGKIDKHIAVISDQTGVLAKQQALKDALESSHKANAAKSNFLAHMSHEIRTPMNAIIGMTSIALAKIGDKVRVQDCLEKIGQSSQHLLGLINDVLDMSKIDNGKLSINHEIFNLRVCIENIVNIIHPQTDKRHQHFEVVLNGVDVDTLFGDGLRLNQILINLLSNATKFTPENGRILFKIEQIEKKPNSVRLRFIIQDSGIGMNEEFRKRVYQPFEQATPGVSAKFGGSGLGLAITRNLVSLMGGIITLKSEEGKGTEFRVEIPFELPETCSLVQHSLETRKILVVDDDPEVCEHACMLLKQLGMHAESAYSGKDAISRIKEAHEKGDPFDICFLDWKMPEMNGEQTARQIRSHFGNETLIIIISAYDWNSIEKDALKVGVSGFVAKPFFSSNLADAILASGGKKREEAKDEKTHNFSGKRILLAEDNDFNREISNEFLEMANIEVENAVNGQEAVNMFTASSENYYDLILMDIQMPVLNGYDATRAIRKLVRTDAKKIPIIAMTANAFNEDVAAALESGMDAHIAKPIDLKDLYSRLDDFLNNSG